MRLPIGELDLSAAESLAYGQGGAAAFIGYSYLGRAVSFSAFVQLVSGRYATVGLEPADDRTLLEAGGSVSVPLGSRLNLRVQYAGADFRDQGWRHRIGVLSSIRLTGRASLFVSANHLPGNEDGPENEVFAGLTYAFGRGITGSVLHQRSGDRASTAMQVQKSPPLRPGFGYRAEGQIGEENRGSGVFRYQGDYNVFNSNPTDSAGSITYTCISLSGPITIDLSEDETMLCPYDQSANTTEGSGLHSLFRHSSASPFARACLAVRTLFFVGFAARTLPAHGFTASLPVTWDAAGSSRAALRIHTSCDATCIMGIAEVCVKTCKNRTEATTCCPFLYSGNANSISDGSSASLAPFKILSTMLIVCRGARCSATPAP